MTAASPLRLARFDPPVVRKNAAIVRSVYAAFSRLARGGAIASYVTAHFHSDCEYLPVEEASTLRGHKALIGWIERWLEAWDDAWDDAWDEIDEIVEADEKVVAAIRVHGRGRKSGMEISQRLFDVFELREGRIVRISEYLDRDQALVAAGLPAAIPLGVGRMRLTSARRRTAVAAALCGSL